MLNRPQQQQPLLGTTFLFQVDHIKEKLSMGASFLISHEITIYIINQNRDCAVQHNTFSPTMCNQNRMECSFFPLCLYFALSLSLTVFVCMPGADKSANIICIIGAILLLCSFTLNKLSKTGCKMGFSSFKKSSNTKALIHKF